MTRFFDADLLTEHFPHTLEGVSKESLPFLINDLLDKKDLLFVAGDDKSMEDLYQALSYLVSSDRLLKFPAWDCLPYDRVSPRKDLLGQRLSTLSALTKKADLPRIILTTVSAFLQRIPEPKSLPAAIPALSIGSQCDLDSITKALQAQGYNRVSNVHEPGEFAIRGGIFDIFPAASDAPYRLDLFGDEVESIKIFDPLSQRSLDSQQSLEFSAVSELSLNKKTIERFRTHYRERFPEHLKDDSLYHSVSDGKNHPGMEHWLPLFYEKMGDLTAYLSDPLILFATSLEESIKHRFEQIQDHYTSRKEIEFQEAGTHLRYRPLEPNELYLNADDLESLISKSKAIYTSPFKSGKDHLSLSGSPVPILKTEGDSRTEAIKKYLTDQLKEGLEIHIACQTQGTQQQLKSQLQDAGFLKSVPVSSWKEACSHPRKLVRFHHWNLQNGYQSDKRLILTEREIFGEIKKSVPKKNRRADLFIAEASSLALGDFVVHEDHGIGQYDGLHTLDVGGVPHDCLKILYGKGDKLFLPVENIELISRYGSEASGAQVDSLGAAGWQERHSKVRKRLEEIADYLMEVAAARSLKKAQDFHIEPGLYEEFTRRFPFNETDDQNRAIDDVLKDLASGKPMDRLVCGDVGFGKTEVAMRAAFVVASQGKQVAVITPTTLLARQHYLNFEKRFSGLGLRVANLSRLVTGKKADAVRKELEEGRIDIVIGTHTLLSEHTKFKDLGLTIVDEEQHFGVKQKERLKELQKDVHVLTLTATPIPRTLQMALTGVRDMSIIATPPVDRLAIRTFITPFDAMVVKEAIHRELNRGGQIFYVCPRIKDLDSVFEELSKLDPDLRIAVAHGQMPATKLEKVMDDFVDKKYDILLATNIIESGIDLQSVNTLFVHRSDLFGLAQLYQLRGRIGRGKLRAYAYLTIPPNQVLGINAKRRLEALQTLDTLGAGFQLASHDMDIRGAGNLLGQEQSGHMREVGVELYQQMLDEAVEKAQSRKNDETEKTKTHHHWSPQFNLGVPVLIPETYVEDLSVRLELYRRLGHLDDQEEIEQFERELLDRFGPYPLEVKNLLSLANLKPLARKAFAHKIDVGPKGLILRFYKNDFPNPEGLITYVSKKAAKLRPDHSIAFAHAWRSEEQIFKGCHEILTEIAELYL